MQACKNLSTGVLGHTCSYTTNSKLQPGLQLGFQLRQAAREHTGTRKTKTSIVHVPKGQREHWKKHTAICIPHNDHKQHFPIKKYRKTIYRRQKKGKENKVQENHTRRR